jgi:PKD repeat protein
MNFTVRTPVVLKSVKVYADSTGSRYFGVVDENGDIVDSSIEFFGSDNTGQVRVELNYPLTEGNYRLVKILGKSLLSTQSGATYPQKLEGIAEITGTFGGQGSPDSWIMFYDWEFAFDEPCGRTPVPVDVLPGLASEAAAFTVSADSLNLPVDGGTVVFTNTTPDAVTAQWNFGDGTFSTAFSPSHSYTEPGVYMVSLTSTGASGCASFALDTIEITDIEFSAIPPVLPDDLRAAVFPNPTGGNFVVHFDLPASQNVRLSLYDLAGRLIKTADYANVQSGSVELDAEGIPDGMYFLTAQIGDRRAVWNVARIR